MDNKKKKQTIDEKRPVDILFEKLDKLLLGNKSMYILFLTITFFGVMGLVWMIPFPPLGFLYKMNAQTFLNWGSFYIAIIIYFYLKLAPTLSYAMLFSIAIMSFFIVQLEYIEKDGGPSVILMCAILTAIGLIGLGLLTIKEKGSSGKLFWHLLTIGPIWLWSKVFEKFNIKY